MDPTVVVAIVLIVAVFVVASVRSGSKRGRPRRKREAALRREAAAIGLSYEPEHDLWRGEPKLHRDLLSVANFLRKAFYGSIHHVHGDTADGPIHLIDVWHGSAAGGKPDPSSPFRQTIAAWKFDGVGFPRFHLTPEDRADRVGRRIFQPLNDLLGTWHDLDFEDSPEFSQRYQLVSPDEEATRTFFSPRLRSFWESLDAGRRWAVVAAGDSVLVYRDEKSSGQRNRELPPDELATFVPQATAIANALRDAAVSGSAAP